MCSRCSAPIGAAAIDTLGSGMINNHLFQSLCICLPLFIFVDSHMHISFGRMSKEGKKEKQCIFCSTFQCMKERMKESKTLISLKWGPLIIGPWRCLSRQPFPGTLLEMSATGNWIHLAVGVQPPLTAFKRRGNICHLSISPVWVYRCDVSLSSLRCGLSALAIKWAA